MIPTGQALGDGRPVYSTTVNAGDARRPDVRSRERVPVDWRVHLQRVHRHLQQAHDPAVGRRRRPTPSRTARTTRRSPALTSSAAATIACPIRRTSTATWASRRSTRRTRSWCRRVIAPVVHRRRADDGAPQQQPARADHAGQQRPAVQHPLEPGPQPRRRRPTIARSASTATPVASASVVYLDLRYSRFIPLAERAANRAVLRSEEPVQHRERRRREPRGDDRRRRQPVGAAARPVPADERLRSAADAAGGEVCVLTSRQSSVGGRQSQSAVTSRPVGSPSRQSTVATGLDWD